MRLRILSFILLLAAAASAQEARITIKQKSGNETLLELATHPVITYEGDNMVVTNDITTIYVPLADISDYTVSDATTGIKSTEASRQFSNGQLLYSGLPAGSAVNVFSIDGKMVQSLSADSEGGATVCIDTLPKGVYIVRTANQSIKIINK